MVFSSALESELRDGIAAEMCLVLRPGGYVLWYDLFFNPKNPDTIGMIPRRVTLAPPLARVLDRLLGRAVGLLSALKFHHLILLRKDGPCAE